jgi:hypothetical protein
VPGDAGGSAAGSLPTVRHAVQVHYCQSCDKPIEMEPRDGHAVCPQCGRAGDTTAFRPLFIVTGASGSQHCSARSSPRISELPARRWIADIHVIALDCPDELRRARISARPGEAATSMNKSNSASGSAATSQTA